MRYELPQLVEAVRNTLGRPPTLAEVYPPGRFQTWQPFEGENGQLLADPPLPPVRARGARPGKGPR